MAIGYVKGHWLVSFYFIKNHWNKSPICVIIIDALKENYFIDEIGF